MNLPTNQPDPSHPVPTCAAYRKDGNARVELLPYLLAYLLSSLLIYFLTSLLTVLSCAIGSVSE